MANKLILLATEDRAKGAMVHTASMGPKWHARITLRTSLHHSPAKMFANSPMQFSKASSLFSNITLIGLSGIRAESLYDCCRISHIISDIGLPGITMGRLARSRAHVCFFTNSSPCVRIVSSAISSFILLVSGPTHVCDSLSSRSLKLTCSR